MQRPWFSPHTRLLIRGAISCLLTGCISFGSSILVIMQDGQWPAPVQLVTAGVAAGLLMANDIKSRMTPTHPA